MPSNEAQAFPPGRRIRQRAGYDRVLRAPSLSNRWFVVYAQKNEASCSRLGVIASKRVMPRAVSRNFAKRLIREVFRREFPVGLALDVVVRARLRIKPENSAEGRSALTQLLQTVRT